MIKQILQAVWGFKVRLIIALTALVFSLSLPVLTQCLWNQPEAVLLGGYAYVMFNGAMTTVLALIFIGHLFLDCTKNPSGWSWVFGLVFVVAFGVTCGMLYGKGKDSAGWDALFDMAKSPNSKLEITVCNDAADPDVEVTVTATTLYEGNWVNALKDRLDGQAQCSNSKLRMTFHEGPFGQGGVTSATVTAIQAAGIINTQKDKVSFAVWRVSATARTTLSKLKQHGAELFTDGSPAQTEAFASALAAATNFSHK